MHSFGCFGDTASPKQPLFFSKKSRNRIDKMGLIHYNRDKVER